MTRRTLPRQCKVNLPHEIIHYVVRLQKTKMTTLTITQNCTWQITEKGFDKISVYSEVLELSEK